MLFLHCTACSSSCTRVLMSRDFLFEVQRLFLHAPHGVRVLDNFVRVSDLCRPLLAYVFLSVFLTCLRVHLTAVEHIRLFNLQIFNRCASSCPNMHKWSNGFQPPIVSGSNERHVVVNKFPLALSVWAVLQPPQSMCIHLLEPKLVAC